jgi:hypothetical protein
MATTNVNFQVKNGLEVPTANDIYVFGKTPALVSPFATFDFSRSKVLDPRITLTRNSVATGYNEFGKLITYANDTPVFECDSFTGESLGLLIEDSAINYALYSEQADNAVWTKTETTVSATTSVAPDGTLTADNFIPSTNSTAHSIEQIVTSTTSAVTISVFVKVNSLVNKVSISPGGANRLAHFDFTNLTVATESAVRSAKIKKLRNGWYRISASYAASATAYDRFRFFASSGSLGNSATASNGTNGILVWGFQFERNTLATSYIQTVASTATRAATQVSITGTTFTDLFKAVDEGTLEVFYRVSEDVDGSRVFVSLNNGTANNALSILSSAENQVSSSVVSGGTTVASLTATDNAIGETSNVVAAYNTNFFTLSANGGNVVTDVTGTVPSFNRIDIGSLSFQSQTYCNTTIRRICFYPIALTIDETKILSV